ncbi:MAG: hypothetical protein V4615_07700, partial [Bacteroidota bacterium]
MKMFSNLQNSIRNSSVETGLLLPALIIFLLLSAFNSNAATKTSTGTVNWGTAASWSPSGVPASGDDVIIRSGDVVTVDNIFTCNNLNLGNGTNSNATLQIIAAGNSLTINGDLKINSGARNKIFLLDAGPGTLNIAGTFSTWGTTGTNSIDVGTGTINFTPAITITSNKQDITFNGAGTINFNAAFTDQQNKLTPYAGCTVNFKSSYTVNTTAANWASKGTAVFWNGSSITPTTAITFNNIQTNTSASATLNAGAGGITVAGATTLGSSSSFTINSGTGSAVFSGSVILGSSSAFTTNKNFEVGGDWTNNGGTFSGSAYTVTLNGSSNSIGGTASTTFGTLQIGRASGSTAVSYTVNHANSCNYLSINGSTVARTLSIASGITFTVNNNCTLNQPTANSITSLLSVGAGTCNISGNLIFSGSNSTTTRVAKIDVTSGTFALTGTVTWMTPNTVVETEVITVSTGTVTFGSSLTMGSQSGTLTVTSTGTINFNGASAPSFSFGGATSPAFTTASGSTLNFYNGFTNSTNSLSLHDNCTTIFTESGTITPSANIHFGHLQINSGKTVTLAGDIIVDGNWINNSGTLSGSYTVIFDGNGTIGGSSSTTFSTIRIGK